MVCLDLEGVLMPEVWIAVAERTGIEDLKLTTRDISDYNQLMDKRLEILRKHNISYTGVAEIINGLQPLDGAVGFLEELRNRYQTIILSDTFYQFGMIMMKKLGFPTLFCHDLIIDRNDHITGYKLRIENQKERSVKSFQTLNFSVIAAGDSYNDTTMLGAADRGILFSPPESVASEFPEYPVVRDYKSFLNKIDECAQEIREA